MVNKINHESGIKWQTLGWGKLRFQKWNSSRQVEYRWTLSTEGNTLGKVVWWLSNPSCLVEVGTPIRIIHRVIVRSIVIRLYHYVIQYDGNLKTERYDFVQVVLLLSLIWTYQGSFLEGVQKYGNREISEGSLVSCCSKDDMAGDGPLPSISTNLYFWLLFKKIKINKEKCPSVVDDRSLHSYEKFIAVKGPKPDTIFTKVL